VDAGWVQAAKRLAGERAAEWVEDGMVVGLGTGSTVAWTVRRLGARVRAGLRVQGVATSSRTEALARAEGIPLADLSAVDPPDLAIDGADAVDGQLDLVKGAGGALLYEKIVARAARRFIVVVDRGKLVPDLSMVPLPVEVVPFGWRVTARRLEALGLVVRLRLASGVPYVTDGGHFLLDCTVPPGVLPSELDRAIRDVVGVVATGFFLAMADTVVVSDGTAVWTMGRPGQPGAGRDRL
jgi:ribose 5-phosphate isomerase A